MRLRHLKPQPIPARDVITENLPLYQCHKQVRAVQLTEVRGTVLFTAQPGIESFEVTQEFIDRNNPIAGGFYVVYADGYASYSPFDAFNDGYKLIDNGTTPSEDRIREVAHAIWKRRTATDWPGSADSDWFLALHALRTGQAESL